MNITLKHILFAIAAIIVAYWFVFLAVALSFRRGPERRK